MSDEAINCSCPDYDGGDLDENCQFHRLQIADFGKWGGDIVVVRDVVLDKPLMRCDREDVWWIRVNEDEINLRELIDTLTATLSVLDELAKNTREGHSMLMTDEGGVERERTCNHISHNREAFEPGGLYDGHTRPEKCPVCDSDFLDDG